MAKRPAAFVSVLRSRPVAFWITVTCAPRTMAPCGSDTSPLITPVPNSCAKPGIAESAIAKRSETLRTRETRQLETSPIRCRTGNSFCIAETRRQSTGRPCSEMLVRFSGTPSPQNVGAAKRYWSTRTGTIIQKYYAARRWSVHFKAKAQFARQSVDGANLLRRGIGDVRHRHGQFTRQKHGCDGLTHLAMHLLGNGAPGSGFLASAAVQGRTHFTAQAIHSRNAKVHIYRKGGAQMFEHQIALFRFGLEQELVDYGGGIGLLAQAGRSLLQGLGPVSLLASFSIERLRDL